MISAIVVKHLLQKVRDNQKIGLVFIYCNFQRQSEQKVEDMLASLLKYLANNHRFLPGDVKDLYDKHQKNEDTAII